MRPRSLPKKNVGDDFREGKMTLPVIRTLKSADSEEKAFWKRVIVDHDQKAVDFETAVSYLRNSEALKNTIELARQFSAEAREALMVFPQSQDINRSQGHNICQKEKRRGNKPSFNRKYGDIGIEQCRHTINPRD